MGSAGTGGVSASAGTNAGSQAGSGGSLANAGAGGIANSGGGSGAAASGGASGAGTGAHCSPGTLLSEQTAWSGHVTQCNGYDPTAHGLPADAEVVRELSLSQPMTAGAPYTLSVGIDVASAGTSLELWGENDACGAAVEKLASATPPQRGVVCAELHPSASYPRVLIVFRGTGSAAFSDITECPAGSCG